MREMRGSSRSSRQGRCEGDEHEPCGRSEGDRFDQTSTDELPHRVGVYDPHVRKLEVSSMFEEEVHPALTWTCEEIAALLD
jgi:hypothetical protein